MKTLKNISLIALLFIATLNISCQNTNETVTLTTQEKEEIIFMLEEEKLAYDVYDYFLQKWGLLIFGNIKHSEQRHINAMKLLLEDNGIEYSLAKEQGVFKNKELQKLYNDLIEKGTVSELEALKVGKLIEEKDIADLKLAIKNTNDNYSINVYENLLNASYNHLNAFNRNIRRY